MMEEVLSRRIKYGNLPDLIIIDGGKGQLSKVRILLKNLLNIELISISKGRDRNAENEKFFSKDGKQIVIEKYPLFYYLLRLRDEVIGLL